MVFVRGCTPVAGAPSCGRAGPAGGKDSPPDLARPRPCDVRSPGSGTPPTRGRCRPALLPRRLDRAAEGGIRRRPARRVGRRPQSRPAPAPRRDRPVPCRPRAGRRVPVRGGSLRVDHALYRPQRRGRHAGPSRRNDAVSAAAAHPARTRPGVLARLLMLPIRAWRLVSVHLPPRCRFHPSCSQYALDALALHGARRGTWLAARRVARCHPWHPGGYDPVPDPNVRSTHVASQT